MSTRETAALQEGVVRIRGSYGFQPGVGKVEVCRQLRLAPLSASSFSLILLFNPR